jgi:hypothetical protein
VNFVVTGLTESYFNPWGLSWLASLQQLAKTSATPVVMDLGLVENSVKFLEGHGVEVFKCNAISNYRQSIVESMVRMAQQIPGKYIYYDADTWFQTNFDEIFDRIGNQVLFAKDSNAGFVAGDSKAWVYYEIIKEIGAFIHDSRQLNAYHNFFSGWYSTVEHHYNFLQLASLQEKDGNLVAESGPVPTVHINNIQRGLALEKGLCFSQRHPIIFEQYLNESIHKTNVHLRLVRSNTKS